MERSILTIRLVRERDAAFAAQRSQLVAAQLGVATPQAKAFAEAVQSVARNVPADAGGTFRLRVSTRTTPNKLEAVVVHSTLGLQQAAAVPSATALGEKIDGGRLAHVGQGLDFFSMESRPDGCTVVRLGVALPNPLPVDQAVLAHWAAPLARVRESAVFRATLKEMGTLCQQRAAAIEQRRELEAELDTLRASHETLSLLAVVASKTDSAVIVMDRHSRVEWVNAGFVRLTGYTPREVAGCHPSDFLHGPHTDPIAAGEITAAFGAAVGHSQELLHYRKDGGTYWASLSITPVFDEAGELSRWICIFSDITKRREAQAALERAREAAEAANRAKSEFLANMSHEIRTPMNAVIGMTELALLTELTPEQREYLGIAKESAESLLRLLNDILDLSKIEAGKIEIDRVEFHLAELIEDTMKALSIRARQKGLKLTWQLPQEVPEPLLGDPVRLRQILVNLVDNAIKFTDTGQVAVRVEPQWQTPGEVGLHFAVTDTGVGIPAGELDRIFEEFTQGDSSTTRRFGGTGLGLAISSHLVRLMEGQMRVESNEGEGSTFHFSLGLGIPPREGRAKRRRRAPSPTPIPDFGGGTPPHVLHVLVADDNAANRILAERILQKRGHHTTAASDGQQVLKALSRRSFDAVLMDVQMPDADGFATTAAIRQMEQFAAGHVPIIAMTAYAMKGDRERCIAAGMDGYLAKPLRARELIALVESMAGAGSIHSRAAAQSTAGTPRGATSHGTPTSLPEAASPVEVEARNPSGDDFVPALARLEGNREILREQMQLFLRDCPAALAEMVAEAEGSNGNGLQRAAHRLKGLASGFDATVLVDCARELEEAGRNSDFSKVPRLCDKLAAEAAGLQQRIEAYLRRS